MFRLVFACDTSDIYHIIYVYRVVSVHVEVSVNDNKSQNLCSILNPHWNCHLGHSFSFEAARLH